MHFIEQLFGLAPDGGNGVLESLLLICFPVTAALDDHALQETIFRRLP